MISAGTIPKSDTPVLLAHGGAGPQDPKGAMFQSAEKKIQGFLKSPSTADLSKLSIYRDKWAEISELEREALRVVRELESDPDFNAGLGASLQSDGVARLSAAYMESRRQKFSAVMNVQDYIHPIDLTLWLQDQRFSVLDSRGAETLIKDLNLSRTNAVTAQKLKSWIKYRRESFNAPSTGKTGTIGVVGVSTGQLVALTSTGGVGNETPGRVGDSPTIAGNFCTQQVAISCTGYGEQIIAHALSPRIAFYYQSGMPLGKAMTHAMSEAGKRDYSFAAIAVAQNETHFEWAAGEVNCQMVWSKTI